MEFARVGAGQIALLAVGTILWVVMPLAIVIHTLLDGLMGLSLAGVITLSPWAMEGIVAIVGCGTFFGAYFLRYKKDAAIATAAKEVSV